MLHQIFPWRWMKEIIVFYIGCRSPAKIENDNTETGKDISTVACSGDADDVFFDP